MKKLFVLTASILLTLSLVSCPGALFAGILDVHISITGEDGKPVTKEVFDKLNCEFVKTEKETVDIRRHSPSEYVPNYGFSFSFGLGSGRNSAAIQSKYIDKLNNHGIKITDSSNTYQDIEMNPLPYKGYKVLFDFGYPSDIEYTVQLKKK